MMTDTDRVNSKELFQDVSEGDQIHFGDRSEPVTVYRHVTEDDHDGQVITMKGISEQMAEQNQWDLENGYDANDALRAGDLMTGEHTGDEFLIARGPRGGCYLLKQWWSKHGGEWSASIALFRRAREETEVWTWENTVNLEIVGREDVDRDAFDEGGDWIRHTEVKGEDVTVWTDSVEGEVWDHSEVLTGTEDREPTDTGPEPWEVMETVSEGDTVRVNGVTGDVTEVSDNYGGVLADGVTVTLDAGGDEYRVRTFAGKGYAGLMSEDISEDVEDVTVNPEDDGEDTEDEGGDDDPDADSEDAGEDSEDSEPATDGGEVLMTDGGQDPEDAAGDAVGAFADSLANLMTGFSDVDPDEEYTTEIQLFIRNREGDDPKVAVSGFTIIPPEEHQQMEREVLDRVDLRKAPRPDDSRARAKTVDIGSITFLGTGEVQSVDVDPEYLKPAARGDGDE